MPTQQAQSFRREITRTVEAKYLLYLPEGYDAKRPERWPLVLFLHGAGERGEDLEVIKKHGLPRVIAEGKDFPFVVVSPQCPTDEWWTTEVLSALLDDVQSKHAVDPDRVYVTGLSMGGFGTWALATAYPNRFAAIAPICGGGQPARARAIRHLPVWTFHGAKDEIVPIKRTEEMVEALKASGGNVRFTVYPEAGHDSWTETYANPELYDWLLSQRRGARTG